VAQLRPQAPDSVSIAICGLQDNGVGILSHIHTELISAVSVYNSTLKMSKVLTNTIKKKEKREENSKEEEDRETDCLPSTCQ
jgi:hypothetical protein